LSDFIFSGHGVEWLLFCYANPQYFALPCVQDFVCLFNLLTFYQFSYHWCVRPFICFFRSLMVQSSPVCLEIGTTAEVLIFLVAVIFFMVALCNRADHIYFHPVSSSSFFLWSPYVIGQTIIFLPCSFFLPSIFLFFPRLISAVGDWMFTILWHMMWP